MLANWFRRIPGLKRIHTRTERRQTRPLQSKLTRLQFEALEERVVPATIQWTGAAGTNLWSTPGNWSTGTVPTSADNVFNPLATQIQVSTAASAKTLDFTGGTAQLRILSGGSLTLGSAAADTSSLNNGLLLDAGGSITATGTVALGGSSTFSGGTINGGTLASGAITGGLHLTGSATQSVGVVTLNGNMAVESGGSYFITVANAHAVAGGGTLLVRSGGSLNASGSVTLGIDRLVNDGTTSISAGTFLTVVNANTHAGEFAVTGALAFTGNTTFASGSSFSGSGTVDFGNRFITVQSNLTVANVNSSGTIDVASGRTFTFSGNSTTTNVGLAGVGGFANTGSLSVAGTSAALTTTLSNSGTITQTVGTLRLGGAVITNQASGTYILSGNSLINNNISGVSAFNNSGIVRKSGGVSELLGALSFNNSGGTLDVVSGALNVPGGTSTGGTYSVASSSGLGIFGVQTVTGTHVGTGGGTVLVYGNGVITAAAAGATLNFAANLLHLNPGTGLGAASTPLVNQGFITLDSSAATQCSLSGPFTNNGTIKITAGTVRLNSFNITNSASAVFELTSDVGFISNSGTHALNNAGTVKKTAGAGVSSLIGSFNNQGGTVQVLSGTLNLPGGTSAGGNYIAAAGATIGLTGSQTISGVFPGSGSGTFSVTGNGSMNGTAVLSFPAGMLHFGPGTSFGNGITNQGFITIDSSTATPFVTGGTIHNAGTITVTAGTIRLSSSIINNLTSGVVDFAADVGFNSIAGVHSFNNSGLLRKSAGTGTSAYIGTFNNQSGSIAVLSGTLNVGAGTSTGGNYSVSSGAFLNFTGGQTITGVHTGSGTGRVNVSGNGFLNVGTAGATLDFAPGLIHFLPGTGWGTPGTSLTNTGTLAIDGTTAAPGAIGGIFNNAGTVLHTSGSMRLNAATINNLSGASYQLSSDDVPFTFLGGSNSITNAGTFHKVAGTGTTSINFAYSNTGVTEAAIGTLAFTVGSLSMNGNAILVEQPGGTISLRGNLAGGTTNASQFNPVGTVLFNGTGSAAAPQILEAMSQDLGATGAGYVRNFAYGTISLSNNTYVRLSDASDNASGTGAEAVYANTLLVPAGTTLDLNGLHLYVRAKQVAGTVVGGTVTTLAFGGDVFTGIPTAGNLATVGGVDDWTFFGRAGQGIAVTVRTGSLGSPAPVSPQLGWATVRVVDGSGNVLGEATNVTLGADATIGGVNLPTDGVYHIQVFAPAGSHSSSTGNYILTVQDASVRKAALSLGQNVSGTLPSAASVDQWTFTAQASEQIRFNLLGTVSSAIRFDLTGPAGFTGFTGATASSGLLTLPSSGTYTLTVRCVGALAGGYAFRVDATTVTTLVAGTPFNGTLVGSGQASLFKVTIAQATQLLLTLTDSTTANHNEMYIKFGSAPTRSDFQYQTSTTNSAKQQLVVPTATPGDWYVLLYGESVPAPSSYTLLAQTGSVFLSSSTPSRAGTAADATLTLTGVGFDRTTSIQLVAGNGTIYNATQTVVDLSTQITVTFQSGSVPAGTYSVRAIEPTGDSSILSDSLTLVSGGSSKLVTSIETPEALGYHQPATLYVNYRNDGDVAMDAPVLVLVGVQTLQNGPVTPQPVPAISRDVWGVASEDDLDRWRRYFELPNPRYDYTPEEPLIMSQNALLTLDPAAMNRGIAASGSGVDTSITQGGAIQIISSPAPAGYSHAIQVLASGATPGVLQPGESGRIPVYYAGWQQPWDFQYRPIVFHLYESNTTTTSESMNWGALKEQMRPPMINPAAWDIVYANVLANMGAVNGVATSGQYVSMLDRAAGYLARLGEKVYDLQQLWSFVVQQAVGFSPVSQLAGAVDAQVDAPGFSIAFGRSFSSSLLNRFNAGPFGLGWHLDGGWTRTLSAQLDGTVTIRDTDGSQRQFQYDNRGGYLNLAGDYGSLKSPGDGTFTLTEADGTVTRFRADGRVDFVQDTNGNRITAGYTGTRLTGLTHSSGQWILIGYNAAGLIESVTDPAGRIARYNYDAANQHLSSEVRPDGQTTTYTYGSAGAEVNALLSTAHPDGTHEYFEYDSQGHLAGMHKDGGAEQVSFAYSEATVAVTNALGFSTTYFYDYRGLMLKSVNALQEPTYYSYDSKYQLTQVTDAVGQFHTFAYDKKGNLIRSTDPLGHVVTSIYSGPFNSMTSITDAKGNVTEYAYDAKGNPTSTTYANGTVERRAFDALGNATSLTNRRGHVTNVGYDSSGRVTSRSYADGTNLGYAYDARGNLTSTIDATGTTILTYDANDRLKKITYPTGLFLEYTYDAAGRRTEMADQDGFTVKYAYDAVGRLAGLTDCNGELVVTYTYDLAGQLKREDKGNGTYTTYDYDAAGQLLHLINHAPDGSINSRFDYTYDAIGLRRTQTTLEGVWNYEYDAIGQLTHAVFASNNPTLIPNQDLLYNYDAAGNRISTVINGVTTLYVANNLNQYTKVGDAILNYDSDGNLIAWNDTAGSSMYTYNDENQIVDAATPNGIWSYSYNAIAGRIAAAHGALRQDYLLDTSGMGNIVGTYNSTGLSEKYFHGIGLASEINATGQHMFFDFDSLGSVVGVSTIQGSPIGSYSRLPFGDALSSNANTHEPLGYIGKWGSMSDGSGLIYMRARSYLPTIGQFTAEDPLGLASGDANTRRYAANNPITMIDPLGLTAFIYNQSTGEFYGGGVYHVGYSGSSKAKGINDPSKQDIEDVGPIPVGTYLVGDKSSRKGPNTFNLSVIAAPRSYPNRSNFLIHGFKEADPRGASTGCIILDSNTRPLIRPGDTVTVISGVVPQSIPINPRVPSNSCEPIASMDPNALTGPAGFGPENYVQANRVFPYRVDFENDSKATAPAQRVDIVNPLDSRLDWSTFALTELGFGDILIAIPPGLQHYQTTVPFTYNGRTIDVLIELGLNSLTGRVFARFESVDPETLLPPDVLTGFLPPEDGSRRGMGHFSYTIRPKSGLASGTQIRNVARITFDLGETIATDQVDPHDPSQGLDPNKQALVTIDAGVPISSVNPLPAVSNAAAVHVSWSGTDDAGGSGVGTYDIYVSEDGGPFELVIQGTSATSQVFTLTSGHTYSFYSMATDNVGHVQPTPGAAMTTLVLEMAETAIEVSSDYASGAVYGQTITLTAAVSVTAGSGSPTGTVQFFIDGTEYGDAVTLVDGVATITANGLNAGVYAVTATYTSDSIDFGGSTTLEEFLQEVTPAPLFVTATDKTKVYGASTPGFTVTFDGFVLNEDASVLSGVLGFGGSASSASHVGSYAIAPSGYSSDNYAITFVSGTLTVTPAALTITADSKSKVYGQANPTLTATFSGFVNGDDAAVVDGLVLATDANAASHVGSYAISASGATAADYTITFVSGTLTITPAALSISIDDKTKIYGQANPTLTATFSGFVNGDDSSVVDGLVLATDADAASHVGSYAITASGATAADYTITFVSGTLTITPAALTITADDKTSVYGQANPTLTATFSGFVNGDDAAVVEGLVLATAANAASHVGSYAITVSGATASDYTITFVSGTLTITPAALIITADDKTKIYGQANPMLTASFSGFVNGDDASVVDGLVLDTDAEITSHVGTYAITASGATASDYTITFVSGTLTVTPAALSISVDDKTKIYGQANPTLTASFSGFVNGDDAAVVDGLVLATAADAASHVGSYAITASGATASDYAITFVSGTLTVNAAATAVGLTVSLNRPLLGTDPLTLTATITITVGAGIPSGTVAFRVGSIMLGSATVGSNGQASLTLAPAQLAALLPAGAHTITAEYAGDADFAGSANTAAMVAVAPVSIQGLVYGDLNNNGEVEIGEQGIAGARITLTGTDDLGNAVNLVAYSDANGVYEFTRLRPSGPGGYTVTETQPANWMDGLDALGTIGGVYVGSAGNDVFSGIVLGDGQRAENYNFGERPSAGSPVGRGDTAGIGFWQNKNGQNLIKALNGGGAAGTVTQLGNWLASNFPNIFGSLSGKTNAEVAAHYKTLFARNGGNSPYGSAKLEAQVMAAALAVYVTNQGLAGTTAVAYGFNVSADGTGMKTISVGSNGAAFGVANNSQVTVMQLLIAVNARSKNGLLYDVNGNGSIGDSEGALRSAAYDVFGDLNDLGGI